LEECPKFAARDLAMSPLARLERMERREWLRAGMAQLSERDHAVIQLVAIEGRSLREAAAALHLSASAIKTAHFRARKRLANTLRSRIPTRPADEVISSCSTELT
jgi:RNA polymerase sigma factor (sigma-70 family)